MRIVIAADSFKECLSAPRVAAALAAGWRAVYPESDIYEVPMADGGEGTAEALVSATGGQFVECVVSGPLGDPVPARYGLLGAGDVAMIEMAAASGLALVPPEQRDVRRASTRGTGQLMADALDRGVRRMIVGIGGSATNDGGAGMACALGFRLLGAQGTELPPGGAALRDLAHIDVSGVHPGLAACSVQVACDVRNPLCGPEGASHVYGPQKGANAADVEALDAALRHYAGLIRTELGMEVLELPGGGAAGGLGAGLVAFTRAELRSGIDLVAEACGLDDKLAGATLVLTGEGRLDRQSAFGKVPVGVARRACAHGVPVIAVAGALGDGFEAVLEHGISAVFPIARGPVSLETAMAEAEPALRRTGEQVARVWRLARQAGREQQ